MRTAWRARAYDTARPPRRGKILTNVSRKKEDRRRGDSASRIFIASGREGAPAQSLAGRFALRPARCTDTPERGPLPGDREGGGLVRLGPSLVLLLALQALPAGATPVFDAPSADAIGSVPNIDRSTESDDLTAEVLAVPEPASLLLAGTGLMVAAARLRRIGTK
jgi:hypothetical protein